jgi:hypothetical protein
MIVRKMSVCLVLLAGLLVGGIGWQAALASQPSYDTLRVDGPNAALPYEVWVAWTPLIVPLPDGSAWAFFSAQAVNPDSTVGTKKLFASRLNPSTGTWSAAAPLKGGQIQFGATAAVDSQGNIHLVYTDRANDQTTSFGQIVYVKIAPDGTFSDPVAIAPSDKAGHQLSPEVVLDKSGGLHAVWQDQRSVDDASRAAAASNADVFSSDLGADGTWSAPVQISVRPDATTNASRPQLATDGDRLVVVWSTYTAASGLDTAAELDWSYRPIDGSAGWAQPQALLQRGNAQIGGKLLDLASNPKGGVTLVYGSRTDNVNSLFAQQLAAGATTWDAPITLAQGDRGSFPAAAIAPDGTLVVAYNLGSGQSVQVGTVAWVPGAPRGSVESVVTAGEDGAQGRPMIDIDANGKVWVIYMHEPSGGVANEIRIIRGAAIATELAPATPATPVAAATPSS